MKLFIKNIGRLVTMVGEGDGLGIITEAACLVKDGKIEWIGKEKEIPKLPQGHETINANGCVVMPGLVDCHTHLVHAGSREEEVAERARGKSYEEIAKAGGGILSTVKATREAGFDELCEFAWKRADEALSKGITTMEVKSGYGLDAETEIKILKVVQWLNKNHPITFIPTFLGAHTLPPEYKDKREKYVNLLVNEMIPHVAEEKLAKFCDVFVEKIAFTVEDGRKILEAGKRYGFIPKLHADQLSSGGGAELAAEVRAVSADHLEYTGEVGMKALKERSVVPVLLPGATFFLGNTHYAAARKMADWGLPVAVATDYNPGTSPSLDLFLMATIAVSYGKLTMEEALKGITVNAAKALCLDNSSGVIKKDGVADLLILNSESEYLPLYRYGSHFVKCVIKGDKIVYQGMS